MPYLKCTKCHHELEGRENNKCDWCGAETRILEEQTPLEKLCKDPENIIKILQKLNEQNK